MDANMEQALKTDRVIDITTTGRKSGEPHRIEIGFYYDDQGLYITGMPGRKRDWLANLSTNPGDAAITDSIIQLGHSLKLRVVAEGVETEEHLNHLRNRGCDEVQGFFYSKPVPAEEFSSWVQLRQRLAVVSW